jgi:integrase
MHADADRLETIRRGVPSSNVWWEMLERGEPASVVTALPEYLRDLVRFAYLTAWRRGEPLSLRWSTSTATAPSSAC